LVAVQLPEPLAERRLVDQGDPLGAREVLDGALLQTPGRLPEGVELSEERILVNNDRLNGWYQSYAARDGAGSMHIAQGSPRGQVLGAVGLGPAGPGEAPVALNATKPLRSSSMDIDGRAVAVVVYAVTPDDRPTQIAMLWDEGETSFALMASSREGQLTIDELTEVVRSMRAG
jgi:hypothetical protein